MVLLKEKQMRRVIFIISCIGICFAVYANKKYDITGFGAKGDGKTINTQYIQKAIDQCFSEGGGRVYIPNGIFLTGTVILKSNVELYLEAQAVLKGSSNMKDYLSPHTERGALIYAYRQDNISISGRGTIDGNGGHSAFQSKDKFNGLPNRPYPVAINQSSNVKLKDFTVKDGAFWNVMLDQCHYVTIDDVTVLSRIVANNDGLDIVDCSNVKVSNCYFDVGDDAICLKSHCDIGVKNVVITNCIAKSESNGIKFGTRGDGGFEDITISNCVLYDTRLSGITLQMVDGGIIDRITINNITMHNVNGSIFLKLGHRKGDTPGILRNVMISNIIADGIGCWKADTSAFYHKAEHNQRIGISLVGVPGYEIENVTLDNIHLQFAGGGTEDDRRREIGGKVSVYPEYSNYGVTPAYGLNCRYVKDLHLNNIRLDYLGEDVRPAIYCRDVSDLYVRSLKAKISEKAPAIIRLKDVSSVFVTNCRPQTNSPFLLLEENVKDISLTGNDFSKITNILSPVSHSTLKDIKGLTLNIK